MQRVAEYGLARVAGGVPVWPQDIEPTLPLFTIVDGLCNDLENVCPKPAAPEKLSASPGEFVPTLKTTLEIYETVHLETKLKVHRRSFRDYSHFVLFLLSVGVVSH